MNTLAPITAHLNGGPCHGETMTVQVGMSSMIAVDLDVDDAGEYYRRRPADLHPASFLNRWGGERVQSTEDFLGNRLGTLLPSGHYLYDHATVGPAGRLDSDATVANLDRSPVAWVILRQLAEAMTRSMEAAAEAEGATIDRRDLEWSGRPATPEGYHAVRCSVVAERPAVSR